MNEEEKKAVRRIYSVTHQSDGSHVDYIDIDDIANTKEDLESCEGFCEAIDTVLNLIDKQNKVIDEMAFSLADYVMYYEYDKCRNPQMIKNKAKEQIEYFFRKVEEDDHRKS